MKQIHPYIIGIAGPSCAGKTCIATQIANSLPSGFTSLISIDDYYRAVINENDGESEKINFDVPDAIEHELLIENIRDLRSSKSVKKPCWDFVTHSRQKF